LEERKKKRRTNDRDEGKSEVAKPTVRADEKTRETGGSNREGKRKNYEGGMRKGAIADAQNTQVRP